MASHAAVVPRLPGKRAFIGTLVTSGWTQVLTVLTGAIAARLLGPEGRGQVAGAQVWPAIFGLVALFGVNIALSLRAARDRENKVIYERIALRFGCISSITIAVVAWLVLPYLIPNSNADLLWLARLMLFYVPVFVLTANLMAVDQGVGDFRLFNTARNVLTPTYMVLLVGLWALDTTEPVWFCAALVVANLAVLSYRLSALKKVSTAAATISITTKELLRSGLPYWVTSMVGAMRENAERLLLLFILGPAALGLYVVAFTASSIHLNLTRSLNLIVFSRGAATAPEYAFNDAARAFRLMALVNVMLCVLMAICMPLLIKIIFGAAFASSLVPAVVLLAGQYFSSQAGILDESMRAQGNPVTGLCAMVAGVSVFAVLAMLLADRFNLTGIASASVAGSAAYCLGILIGFYRVSGVSLKPTFADALTLCRIASEMKGKVCNIALTCFRGK